MSGYFDYSAVNTVSFSVTRLAPQMRRGREKEGGRGGGRWRERGREEGRGRG